MKKVNATKKLKEVVACWYDKVEWYLIFMCPHCNKTLYDWNFINKVDECEAGTKILTCIYCKKKFKLTIKE